MLRLIGYQIKQVGPDDFERVPFTVDVECAHIEAFIATHFNVAIEVRTPLPVAPPSPASGEGE